MESKTKEELISQRKCFIWLYPLFVLTLFSGIIICSLSGIGAKFCGGLLIGVSVAMMVIVGVCIGECNEELRQLKVKESKQRLDVIFKKDKEMGDRIMEMRELIIYDNLRFREDVLRDKFGGITHKGLRKDFLEFECFPGVQVKDAINLIIRFNFKYKDVYRRALMMFQEKQAVLKMYEEKPKKVGKRNVKN